MKKGLLLIIVLALLATTATWAQEEGTQEKTPATETQDTFKMAEYPSDVPYRIGIRGGLNIADMVYTNPAPAMRMYTHTPQLHGMGSIFLHLGFGNSGFAISPEVGIMGKGVKLNWDDVDYRMSVRYFDFRMPLSYNFRLKSCPALSPYIMVVPDFGASYGGKITYEAEVYTPTNDDYRYKTSTDITRADVNRFDFGVMFGAGVDYLVKTKNFPLIFSLEAGWNMGLANTFAERENLDEQGNLPPNASNIINRFFGAELWHNERFTRGIEIAARVALPLTGWRPKAKEKVEEEQPVEVPYAYTMPRPPVPAPADTTPEKVLDTVTVNGFDYVKKDCYSLYDIYKFIVEGVDISDKRICMYNINFDFDKDVLRPESYDPLNKVLELLNKFPEISIEIYGHTDSIGTAEYNQGLSERRAASAARYLVEQGIDPKRITPIGFGLYLPIDTNETEDGRFHNRRVEFEILNVENINRDRLRKEFENYKENNE